MATVIIPVPACKALGLATRTAFSCCRNERGPISANFWLGVGSPLMPEAIATQTVDVRSSGL